MDINKKELGQKFKGDSKILITYLETMQESCKLELKEKLSSEPNQCTVIEVCGK